jgi:L-threonylcarbamoyladenylate synthase
MPIPLLQAVEVIRTGGVLIYPTETFYALGGDATNPLIAGRTEALKSRPAGKPFPVLIGSWELLWTVVDRLPPLEEKIMRCFWPGPLSVLLPCRADLPAQVRGDGTICVRWTSHPLAAALSRESSRPLIATSANRSDQPPASRPWEVDRALGAQTDQFITEEPWPTGGAPSTIIRCEGERISVLRTGAVSIRELQRCGFEVGG